ncbi:MAG: hypothetical protein ACTSU5_18495 [Promethearchaeota archaeon]
MTKTGVQATWTLLTGLPPRWVEVTLVAGEPRARRPTGALLGVYAATFTTFAYFERVASQDYFQTTPQYLLLVGVVLAGFSVTAAAAGRLGGRSLDATLFAVLVTSATAWLYLALNIPGQPGTGVCGAWMCGTVGQLVLACSEVGVLPPLLVEWVGRASARGNGGWRRSTLASTLAGGTCSFVTGLLSLLGYAWALLSNSAVFVVAAALVLFSAAKSPRVEYPGPKEVQANREVLLPLGDALRTVVVLVVVVVSGLSTTSNDTYSFGPMALVGVGWLAWGLFFWLSTKGGAGKQLYQDPGFKVLDVAALGVLAVATGVFSWLVLGGENLDQSMALPPLVVGFGYGFVWQRVRDLVLSNIDSSPSGPKDDRPGRLVRVSGLPAGGLVKLAVFLLLMLVLALALVQVDSNGTDSYLIYLVGFVLSLVTLVGSGTSRGKQSDEVNKFPGKA